MLPQWLMERMCVPVDTANARLVDVVEKEEPEPLRLLELEYENLAELLRGKRVADFGCGWGRQSVALVKQYGCRVTGIDTNPRAMEISRALAAENGLTSSQIDFAEGCGPEHQGAFDVVISQNSMEHFGDPAMIVGLMAGLLKPDGRLLITFGPPWFAPFGSHMRYFCKMPWVNLLFSEETVMRVRRRYRDDGATKYGEIESGLNQMSLGKFERIIRASGLRIEHSHNTPVSGAGLLARLPVLRELFTNHVSVTLRRA